MLLMSKNACLLFISISAIRLKFASENRLGRDKDYATDDFYQKRLTQYGMNDQKNILHLRDVGFRVGGIRSFSTSNLPFTGRV